MDLDGVDHKSVMHGMFVIATVKGRQSSVATAPMQAEGGAMTVARLRRKALKQALHGQEASKQMRAEASRVLMSRVQGSKSFSVHGDSISLTSQR